MDVHLDHTASRQWKPQNSVRNDHIRRQANVEPSLEDVNSDPIVHHMQRDSIDRDHVQRMIAGVSGRLRSVTVHEGLSNPRLFSKCEQFQGCKTSQHSDAQNGLSCKQSFGLRSPAADEEGWSIKELRIYPSATPKRGNNAQRATCSPPTTRLHRTSELALTASVRETGPNVAWTATRLIEAWSKWRRRMARRSQAKCVWLLLAACATAAAFLIGSEPSRQALHDDDRVIALNLKAVMNSQDGSRVEPAVAEPMPATSHGDAIKVQPSFADNPEKHAHHSLADLAEYSNAVIKTSASPTREMRKAEAALRSLAKASKLEMLRKHPSGSIDGSNITTKLHHGELKRAEDILRNWAPNSDQPHRLAAAVRKYQDQAPSFTTSEP